MQIITVSGRHKEKYLFYFSSYVNRINRIISCNILQSEEEKLQLSVVDSFILDLYFHLNSNIRKSWGQHEPYLPTEKTNCRKLLTFINIYIKKAKQVTHFFHKVVGTFKTMSPKIDHVPIFGFAKN